MGEAVPYLVDGDNLLGTWSGRRRSDAGRRKLAFDLHRFARRIGKRLVAVFDGTAPGRALQHDVLFAGAGRSADDVILAFLRDEQDRRGWTVVTSDRSLGDQCRYMGARIERSDVFRKRLQSTPEGEKPESETDVDYWLERFGDGKDPS